MKTCKSCLHWTRSKRESWLWEPHTDFGKCDSEKFVDTSNLHSDSVFPPKDGLSYSDSESYEAHLETGEDFGCIHFKERGE